MQRTCFIVVLLVLAFKFQDAESNPLKGEQEDSKRERLIRYLTKILSEDQEEKAEKRDHEKKQTMHKFGKRINEDAEIAYGPELVKRGRRISDEKMKMQGEIVVMGNETVSLYNETLANEVTKWEENDGHKYPKVKYEENIKRSFYDGDERQYTIWPNGAIPYNLESSVTAISNMGSLINDAFLEFNARTCLQFTQYDGQSFPYMRFFANSPGCWATVGYVSNQPSDVNLNTGCDVYYIVLHEIMHAIGMIHNQQRSDRTDFLSVHYSNMNLQFSNNFELALSDNTGSFDLNSVLQYGLSDFTKNGNKVMTVSDAKLAYLAAEQHRELGYYDLLKINTAYQCTDGCNDACSNRGYSWKPSGGQCRCHCVNRFITGQQCDTILNAGSCSSSVITFTTKGTQTLNVMGYPNTECAYLVEAPQGYRLKATMTKLDLPVNGACTHEVDIRYNLRGQPGVKYCGTLAQLGSLVFDTTINGEPNTMMFILDARDTSVTDTSTKGFTVDILAYKSGCSSNPCKNGATCVDDPDTETHQCNCAPSYSGADCNTVTDGTVTCDVETSAFGNCFLETPIITGSVYHWQHRANRGDKYDTSNGYVYLQAWSIRRFFSSHVATMVSTPSFSALPRTLYFDYYLEIDDPGLYLEVRYSPASSGTPNPLIRLDQNTNAWLSTSVSIPAVSGLQITFIGRPVFFGRVMVDNIRLEADVETTTTEATTTTTSPTTTTTSPTTTTTSPTTTTTSPTTTTTSPTTTTTSPTTTTTSPTTTTTSPTTTTTSPTTTTTSPTTTTTSPTTTTTSPTTTTTSPTTTTTSPTTTTTSPTTTTTSPTTTTTSPTTTTTSPTTTTTSPTTTTTSPTTTTTSPTTTTTSPTTTTTSPTTTTTSPTTTTTSPTTTTTSPTTTTTSPTTTTTSPTTTTTSPTTTTTSPTTTTTSPTTTTTSPTTTTTSPTTTTTSPTTTTTSPTTTTTSPTTTTTSPTTTTTSPTTTTTSPTTTTTSPTTNVISLPATCNAEGGSCVLEQATNDDFNWTRHQGPTRSFRTGPFSAIEGTYYYYIEASYPRQDGDYAILQTDVNFPEQDICLTFWYNMWASGRYSDGMGELQVLVSGTNVNEYVIWSRNGNQGSQWFQTFFKINATSGLQVKFKGIRGSSYKSDIAIDDIKFENTCPIVINAEVDLSETIFSNVGSIDWQRVENSRLAAEGSHYFFVQDSTQSAVLEADDGLPDGELCISFWYSMSGSSESHLRLITSGDNLDEAIIWSMEGSKGRYWHYQYIDIAANDDHEIKIEAKPGSGYVALDDILITNSKCEMGYIHCSFESRTLYDCPVYNKDDDEANWRLQKRHTPSYNTGPYSADSGRWYLYLEATGLTEGDNADLVVSSGFPDGPSCLCFKYHMYGDHMGSLSVLNGTDTVFNVTESQDNRNEWHLAVIDVTLSRASQVVIRATRGSNYQSDIAIDELIMSQGTCCKYKASHTCDN